MNGRGWELKDQDLGKSLLLNYSNDAGGGKGKGRDFKEIAAIARANVFDIQ